MSPRTGFPLWYVVFLGVSAIAYDFTGYDTSSRLSEETSTDPEDDTQVSSARGIVYTVVASGLLGTLVAIALLFATTNIPLALSGSATVNTGNAAVNVLETACGVPVAAAIVWSFIFFNNICGVSIVTGTSRVCYALARDNLLPCSEWLAEIDEYTKCPVNSTIAVGVVSVLITLIGLTPINQNAFYCMIGISTVRFTAFSNIYMSFV